MEAPASVAEIRERNPDAFAAFERAREQDPSLSPHLVVHKPWIDERHLDARRASPACTGACPR